MTLSQLRSERRLVAPKPARRASPEIDLSNPAIQRTLSRRRLLKAAAGLSAGAMMATGFSLSAAADSHENGSDPQPIPGGFELGGVFFHVYPPLPGLEPSSIGSFRGVVALSELIGMGTTGDGERLPFLADQRFMIGEYVGMDGSRYNGAFGFI